MSGIIRMLLTGLEAAAILLPVFALTSKTKRKKLWVTVSFLCLGLMALVFMILAAWLLDNGLRTELVVLSIDGKRIFPRAILWSVISNGVFLMKGTKLDIKVQWLRRIWPWIILGVIVLYLFIQLVPMEKHIYVETTAYCYKLDRKEPLSEHRVVLDVTWRKERPSDANPPNYLGTLYVENWETEEINIAMTEDHSGWVLYQQTQQEPWQAREIYFSRDRQQFTILYAEHDLETEEPGMYYRGEFDPESGIVLVANAPDYETMITLSGAVGVPYALGDDGIS